MAKLNDTGDAFDSTPQRVYVESDWYDGPRAGLADVDGVPHYFAAINHYDRDDEHDDAFLIWPASANDLQRELIQWHMFVDWRKRWECGESTIELHPGHGGIDAEYDELTRVLQGSRTPPQNARIAQASWSGLDVGNRYSAEGPHYVVRWRILTR